jgi:rare lipoprotein A
MRIERYLSTVSIIICVSLLAGCGAGTIVTAPIAGAVITTPIEYAAKGVWWTGKTAVKGTYFLGKGTVNVLTYPFRDDQLEGVASWYGSDFHKKPTSSGEIYDMHKLTAAHKELPLGTFVEVRNMTNGKMVVVKINDRGPFVGNRIIDLSFAAAKEIDMIRNGTAPVKLRVLD